MDKKQKQLDYLHVQIMDGLCQIKLLTQKISEEENALNIAVMSDMAYKAAQRASKMNEKLGRLLNL